MALDPSYGYVAGTTVQDPNEPSLPIFNVERVQLQFPLGSDFVAAQVANNVLIIALTNGRILRIDLEHAEDIDGKQLPLLEWRDANLSQTLICPRRLPKLASSAACFLIQPHHT
jgi:hypothetical protein